MAKKPKHTGDQLPLGLPNNNDLYRTDKTNYSLLMGTYDRFERMPAWISKGFFLRKAVSGNTYGVAYANESKAGSVHSRDKIAKRSARLEIIMQKVWELDELMKELALRDGP